MDLLSSSESGSESALNGSTQERLAQAAESLKSKRGGSRAGAGRKPGGGKPRAMGAPPAAEEAPVENVASPADIEFVSETAKSVVTCLDKFFTRRVYDSVAALDPKLEETADKLAAQVHVSDDEVKLIGNIFASLATKYGGIARFAPEMALAGWCATYGMRVNNVLGEVKKLTIAVQAMKGKGAGPSQADKDSHSG